MTWLWEQVKYFWLFVHIFLSLSVHQLIVWIQCHEYRKSVFYCVYMYTSFSQVQVRPFAGIPMSTDTYTTVSIWLHTTSLLQRKSPIHPQQYMFHFFHWNDISILLFLCNWIPLTVTHTLSYNSLINKTFLVDLVTS